MKTNAKSQSEFKARQKKAGLVRLGIDWVTEQQKSDIKLYLSGKATIVKQEDLQPCDSA